MPCEEETVDIALEDYPDVFEKIWALPEDERRMQLRTWAKSDLYFLLRFLLKRKDMEKQWLLERCREVQRDPNGHLDLWSREHYKSTIITFGLTIQDILKDPNITVGIFSHTRPIAKGFLRQIKREFETNEMLIELFSDVLWANPNKEAPKWSEDDGLIVKRTANPKEGTLEAYGLVDGQPTSKHFKLMLYDDVVTLESVRSPEMIEKTTESWEVSRNLASVGGWTRYIGTRYHFNDTWGAIISRDIVKERIYPATIEGTVEGTPVLMPRELLDIKRKEMGPYTFACQMLQNPKADGTMGFKREWMQYYEGKMDGDGLNVYIMVDPAGEKKKENDYSVFFIVGLGSDDNYYILDFYRDRLNLTERTNLLFKLHRTWKPYMVGYEKYGKDSDIEHIRSEMTRQKYTFGIVQLGGSMPKNDRIRQLIPIFEQGRVFFPQTNYKADYEGQVRELVGDFENDEFLPFPVPRHDDMLDCLARIFDLELSVMFPETRERKDRYDDRYGRRKVLNMGSWMGR